jgi:hypothetical protein
MNRARILFSSFLLASTLGLTATACSHGERSTASSCGHKAYAEGKSCCGGNKEACGCGHTKKTEGHGHAEGSHAKGSDVKSCGHDH